MIDDKPLNDLLFEVYRAGFNGDLSDYEVYKTKAHELIRGSLEPESETVYRCFKCKEITSPPRPGGIYVECGKCGGVTSIRAAVERPGVIGETVIEPVFAGWEGETYGSPQPSARVPEDVKHAAKMLNCGNTNNAFIRTIVRWIKSLSAAPSISENPND